MISKGQSDGETDPYWMPIDQGPNYVESLISLWLNFHGYLWVTLSHNLHPWQKQIKIFLTENICIYKIKSPAISKNTTIHKNWCPLIYNDSTVCLLIKYFHEILFSCIKGVCWQTVSEAYSFVAKTVHSRVAKFPQNKNGNFFTAIIHCDNVFIASNFHKIICHILVPEEFHWKKIKRLTDWRMDKNNVPALKFPFLGINTNANTIFTDGTRN